MRCFLVSLLCLFSATASFAETLTSVRAIRPMTIISAEDLASLATDVPGAIDSKVDIIGLEARITLYPGRPIRPGDVGPPALVKRNEFVPLIYQKGGLVIMAEGRALGRAAAGEWVRVMNVSSRTTVSGRVASNGSVHVSPNSSTGKMSQ